MRINLYSNVVFKYRPKKYPINPAIYDNIANTSINITYSKTIPFLKAQIINTSGGIMPINTSDVR